MGQGKKQEKLRDEVYPEQACHNHNAAPKLRMQLEMNCNPVSTGREFGSPRPRKDTATKLNFASKGRLSLFVLKGLTSAGRLTCCTAHFHDKI